RAEIGLAHHRQNLRRFGDVEGGLAAQLHGIAASFLPGDEMWQEFPRRLLVADEIVVDKIDRGLDPGGEQRVEFGKDLLRRCEARLTPVKRGDIAEFTA